MIYPSRGTVPVKDHSSKARLGEDHISGPHLLGGLQPPALPWRVEHLHVLHGTGSWTSAGREEGEREREDTGERAGKESGSDSSKGVGWMGGGKNGLRHLLKQLHIPHPDY